MKKLIISESQSNVLDLLAKQKKEKDSLFSKHTDKKDDSFYKEYRTLAKKHDVEIEGLKKTIKTESKRKKQMYNHLLSESVFEQKSFLKENFSVGESSAVKTMINAADWQTPQNPRDFRESLMKSRHVKMLTPYSESELSKMRLFKLEDYNIGFALKMKEVEVEKDGIKKNTLKYCEIVAVHNNEPEIKGIGDDLMRAAIRNKGVYLDHFDGHLTDFYEKNGFVEIPNTRDKYDPQYDEDGSFRNRYGEKDIIYRRHKDATY